MDTMDRKDSTRTGLWEMDVFNSVYTSSESESEDDSEYVCRGVFKRITSAQLKALDQSDPCVCSSVWGRKNPEHMSPWGTEQSHDKTFKKETKKPNVRKRYRSKSQEKQTSESKYVFRHYEDSHEYIRQYRKHHTVGNISGSSGQTPQLGRDTPDPYLNKLRNCR